MEYFCWNQSYLKTKSSLQLAVMTSNKQTLPLQRCEMKWKDRRYRKSKNIKFPWSVIQVGMREKLLPPLRCLCMVKVYSMFYFATWFTQATRHALQRYLRHWLQNKIPAPKRDDGAKTCFCGCNILILPLKVYLKYL